MPGWRLSARVSPLGVAIPDLSDPFFARLTREIEQIARSRGLAVLITSLGNDGADERTRVEALLRRRLIGRAHV